VKTRQDLVAEGLVITDVPLAPFTTYKFGGAASYFAEPKTVADLRVLVECFAGEQLLLLGRGSNMVVADRGFEGLVVRLGGTFNEISFDGELVRAGGAVSLPILARTAVDAGRGGLEWCVGVPGSVGGAVRMNAGCHGSDVAGCLHRAEVMDLRDATISSRGSTDLELRYRHSNLQMHDAVLGASFITAAIEPAAGAETIREITRWRRRHQPGGTLNAGSVFKNPEGDAAGKIIDEAGLKGFRRGGVRVSPRHANFFEADATASAQELFDLVGAVQREVAERTGVWLEPEIRFVGEFDPSPDAAAT
jgi:UDP-N-acetylmuramate dehydrogenase